MGDCFKSTGKSTTETRVTDGFNTIKVNDGINLFITQGNETSIQVKAGKNLMKHIKTDVANNVLNIENNNKCNWVRSFKKKIDVHITCPSIREIKYEGYGDIVFQNEMLVDTFLLNMFQASGNLNLKLNGSYIELKIHTGPADIDASGTANELVLFNNGNGILNAESLITQSALVVNRNTGKIKVNANQKLKAEISGSGDIYYRGNPIVEFLKFGKGDLRPI